MLGKLETPSTSVIIPIANSTFLEECLDSICGQTTPPDEIIFVFNGVERIPEVDTYGIMQQVMVKPEKIGPAAARNLGIRVSRGDILFFQDADDVAYAHRIEQSVAILKTGNWGLVFGNVDLCDINGVVYKKNDIHEEYNYDLLRNHNMVPSASVAVRKEVFETVGAFNEDLLVAEDYDLWLRIGKEYPIYQLDGALYKYRDWDGSQSKRMKHLYPEAEARLAQLKGRQ